MFLMFAVDRSVAAAVQAVRDSAPPRIELTLAVDWTDLFSRASSAGCVVVHVFEIDSMIARQLRALRSMHPLTPIIVVTNGDLENARRLVGLPIDAVVWIDRVATEFWRISKEVRAAHSLERMAGEIEAAVHLPTQLRYAMSIALRTVPPPSSVAALADLAGCHRSTLSAQWADVTEKATSSAMSSPRLLDFVAWLVLLHALGRKPRNRKWSVVADDCDIHVRTLRRLSLRLTGLQLRDLENSNRERAVNAFRTALLRSIGVD